MKQKFSSALVCTLLALAMIAVSLNAQTTQPKFKAGDRVEVNNSHGQGAWQKGTSLQVNAKSGAYVVQLDPLPGAAPLTINVPIYWDAQGYVRIFGGAAPNIPVDKLHVDGNNTVLADRDTLDCQSVNANGKNGAPPSEDFAKKLIRCVYEKPSPAGQDSATTMNITEYTLGAPHRWRVHLDIGQGDANTLVYPIHVRWNQKTFYRSRDVAITDREATFTCYADTTSVWKCGIASGANKDGKTQEIMVKP